MIYVFIGFAIILLIIAVFIRPKPDLCTDGKEHDDDYELDGIYIVHKCKKCGRLSLESLS